MLCPKCQVDRHVVSQMLHSHEIEERIIAQTIINNCPECRKEFICWNIKSLEVIPVNKNI